MPDTVEITVDRLVAGGDGLGTLPDGAYCFVPRLFPGERARVQVEERRKGHARACVVELLEPSPRRHDPSCEHAHECGGCPWMPLPLEVQLEWKERILREALQRTGHLDTLPTVSVHTSPETGYRDRVRWKVRVRKNELALGYFRTRSHELVPIRACTLLEEPHRSLVVELRELLLPLSKKIRHLEEVVQDATPSGSHLLFVFGGNRAPAKPTLEDLGTRVGSMGGVVGASVLLPGKRKPIPLSGSGSVRRTVGEISYSIHGAAFFQVNQSLREPFVDRVVSLAGRGDRCLDLYCGVGLLSLPLAGRFETCTGIESGTEAVHMASKNAAAHGQGNLRFVEARVERWLEANKERGWDAVVADPPRAGLGTRAARILAELGQSITVLVGCDPVSFARDLGVLVKAGHVLETLDLFDFFPGSHHFESVARLQSGR